jgi:hypothetical protein
MAKLGGPKVLKNYFSWKPGAAEVEAVGAAGAPRSGRAGRDELQVPRVSRTRYVIGLMTSQAGWPDDVSDCLLWTVFFKKLNM